MVLAWQMLVIIITIGFRLKLSTGIILRWSICIRVIGTTWVFRVLLGPSTDGSNGGGLTTSLSLHKGADERSLKSQSPVLWGKLTPNVHSALLVLCRSSFISDN